MAGVFVFSHTWLGLFGVFLFLSPVFSVVFWAGVFSVFGLFLVLFLHIKNNIYPLLIKRSK